jgi:hypothetical protein
MPISRKHVAKPPVTRYLTAASLDRGFLLVIPVSTYSARLTISSVRKIVRKSDAATRSNMPDDASITRP